MPIYEYTCLSCGDQFELLVREEQAARSCPQCESSKLERLISLPSVKSSSTHALAMKAAKERDRKQGELRTRTQREYELSHDD